MRSHTRVPKLWGSIAQKRFRFSSRRSLKLLMLDMKELSGIMRTILKPVRIYTLPRATPGIISILPFSLLSYFYRDTLFKPRFLDFYMSFRLSFHSARPVWCSISKSLMSGRKKVDHTLLYSRQKNKASFRAFQEGAGTREERKTS